MSIRLKLILAFAGVFTVGFGALGYGAVRASAESVERSLSERTERTLEAIRRNPQFFLHRAELRPGELRALAEIVGFEIVVLEGDRGPLIGSSLGEADAKAVAASLDTDEVPISGGLHRLSVARVSGRTLCLLTPSAPVDEAKQRARLPILWVVTLGLGASILLGAVLAGSVTRPLRRLAGRAAAVSEGNLDVEVPEAGGGEVGELAAAFREMLAGLARYRDELVQKEKMATLGGFSAAVAHELRNPLSGMRMTVEMLCREAGAGERPDLELLLSEMTRLDHAVEELLFYAGEPRYVFEEADVTAVAESARGAVGPLAEHLGVELVVESSPRAITARADPRRLRQAFLNLLLNALYASPGDGRVLLEVKPSSEGAVVTVSDSGEGVADEIEATMFDAFVSGREGGTGLGLSVTQAIAVAHGGEVRYRRSEGRTVFTLTLAAEG